MQKDLVMVERSALLEYIEMAQATMLQNKHLSELHEDSKTLAGIIEETYKQRIDKLTDVILNVEAGSDYERGLRSAYNIITGR
jgi:hypothetical protein